MWVCMQDTCHNQLMQSSLDPKINQKQELLLQCCILCRCAAGRLAVNAWLAGHASSLAGAAAQATQDLPGCLALHPRRGEDSAGNHSTRQHGIQQAIDHRSTTASASLDQLTGLPAIPP